MTDATDRQIIFGIPGEWKDCEKRHPLFFERFPHLRKTLNTTFIRTGTSSEAIDKFVFLYTTNPKFLCFVRRISCGLRQQFSNCGAQGGE
jgi:hypothetical protein